MYPALLITLAQLTAPSSWEDVQVDGARYAAGAGGSGLWTFPTYAAGAVSKLASKQWGLEVPAGLVALVRVHAQHAAGTHQHTADGPCGAALRGMCL